MWLEFVCTVFFNGATAGVEDITSPYEGGLWKFASVELWEAWEYGCKGDGDLEDEENATLENCFVFKGNGSRGKAALCGWAPWDDLKKKYANIHS